MANSQPCLKCAVGLLSLASAVAAVAGAVATIFAAIAASKSAAVAELQYDAQEPILSYHISDNELAVYHQSGRPFRPRIANVMWHCHDQEGRPVIGSHELLALSDTVDSDGTYYRSNHLSENIVNSGCTGETAKLYVFGTKERPEITTLTGPFDTLTWPQGED